MYIFEEIVQLLRKYKAMLFFRENELFCENLPRFNVLQILSQKCPVSLTIGSQFLSFFVKPEGKSERKPTFAYFHEFFFFSYPAWLT
jgi:hypothetical protein